MPGWTASTTTQQLRYLGNKCGEYRSILSSKISGEAQLIADYPLVGARRRCKARGGRGIRSELIIK